MKKKDKILMCCSELSVKGGMVSVVKNYLNYSDWDDYEIVYIPTHTEKNKIIVTIYFAIAYIKILACVFTQNVKIAHLHTAERGSFFRKAILVRTLKKLGVKTIMHHHAAEFEEFYSQLSDSKKNYVNKTLEMADLNIVLSKRLVSMITAKAPKAKVEVLYNAVPTYKVNPRSDKARNVLFLGRLGKRKGTYDLLQAIKNIDEEIPKNIRFYLCGDGDVEGVKKEIDKLEISKRIAYIGWINADEKKQIYKDIALNVLPSYNEGLPMSILETMAYGIPSITTNIASIPEVVFDGNNGFLIEPGNIKQLSDKLKLILNDDKLCKDMGNRAYRLITDKFALSTHIAHLKNIYASVLENKR
jgi:glycosyltransferase involved in cell wall biosynthesis